MKYEPPEIEVIRFGDDDIVRTSGNGTELPIDEASAGAVRNISSLF